MERYSKKREAILACFRSTTVHPSAEWVYRQLKPQYPDLSLATVYRNIRELTAEGLLCSVGVVKDKERFDGRTDPHTHAVCIRCGGVADADGLFLPPELLEQVEKRLGFTADYAQLRLVGLCASCRREEEAEK